MKVYKFGGASIKSAEAVNNMIKIVEDRQPESLVVVVSAMGKTTNALEDLYHLALKRQPYKKQLDQLITYHHDIALKLLNDQGNGIFETINQLGAEMEKGLDNPPPPLAKAAFYDSIVSYGERLSSRIIHAAMHQKAMKAKWINARDFIITDFSFREAKINWEKTENNINGALKPMLQDHILLTQGFIGGTPDGAYTTLGREGSDFTAAIIGSCLKAQSVTIWKDVPGILNADPKIIQKAVKFENLNYHEAAEMTYYGASVIHPKTIKPLANANIPLLVKSFEQPSKSGTSINADETVESVPSIIFKPNQSLVTFKVKDFTFINENNLSIIFHLLDQLNIKINMMQNSAISFSICIDNQVEKISELIASLKNDFEVQHHTGLSLTTVKNYDQETLDKFSEGKEILLEQKTKHTFQIVVEDQHWKYMI
ncbi:aspartate kinase [Fulvivirgaceae bacterium BMA12]|uniref:Aspartokinase n=1 Tax=Agaribacillus aureus TaxID=3051825 RepID=A0ABT8L607_9BACT|nr:aspartate kinase [Fulvivirgaceae bacterium BMA12]